MTFICKIKKPRRARSAGCAFGNGRAHVPNLLREVMSGRTGVKMSQLRSMAEWIDPVDLPPIVAGNPYNKKPEGVK